MTLSYNNFNVLNSDSDGDGSSDEVGHGMIK